MINQETDINETYLGFIQNTISRLAKNSFQAKAWCITILSALLIFYLQQTAENPHTACIYISCGVAVLFCLLDTYYLYLERGYRKLYKIAAHLDETGLVSTYDMSIPKSELTFQKYKHALFSVTTGLFYLIIIILLLILMYYTKIS